MLLPVFSIIYEVSVVSYKIMVTLPPSVHVGCQYVGKQLAVPCYRGAEHILASLVRENWIDVSQ